jgi:putative MATE family efflux protein
LPLNASPPIADTSNTLRPLLRLAWPVLIEELLNMLVGYTDWYLAAHYLEGTAYRAAMGLIAYSLWLIPSLFSAIAIGAVALTARMVGAGQWQQARHVTAQALLGGTMLAIVATLLTWFGAPAFTRAMQLETDAAALTVRYLNILVPIIPLMMLEQVGIACLRGAGDTRTGLAIKVLVNVVNTGLSVVLLLGWGPFPKLGWEGIAIGTAAGHGLAGIIILLLLIRGRAGLKLQWSHLRPDWPLLKRLLRVGLPGGIDVLSVIACHLAYVSIINRLGTLAAAAHGLAIQIEAIAYLPGSAFQIATATMTGQLLGAHQPNRATRSALTALGLGGGFMCSAGVVLFLFGPAIAGFFTGDSSDPTAQLAGQLLPIVAIGMPCFATLSIFSGTLRGAGDTRWPLIVTFVGLIGIRIPGAAYLAWEHVSIPWLGLSIAGCGLGVQGAWYAMLLDVLVRSLLISTRFFSGRWKSQLV